MASFASARHRVLKTPALQTLQFFVPLRRDVIILL
jgi:hypothetical protein